MFRLLAVRAADGASLASRALTFGPCAVAVDPVRPWLYVAGMSVSTIPPGSVLQV